MRYYSKKSPVPIWIKLLSCWNCYLVYDVFKREGGNTKAWPRFVRASCNLQKWFEWRNLPRKIRKQIERTRW